MAAREAETDIVKSALTSVVHLALNVADSAGAAMAELYVARSQFPVFILLTPEGEVISRWVGYVDAHRFVGTLRAALNTTVTVEGRKQRVEESPTFQDAYFLAGYSEGVRAYTDALEYYRLAARLGKMPGTKLDQKIYQAAVNAAWNDQLPYDSAVAEIDHFLSAENRTAEDVISAIGLLTRLALQKDQSRNLAPWVNRAIVSLRMKLAPDKRPDLMRLLADSAMFSSHDTVAALDWLRQSFGGRWQDDPRQVYRFADWCWERKVNLEEARQLLAGATRRMRSEMLRGMSLHLLAQVVDYEGDTQTAVRLMEMAVESVPQNLFYKDELDRFRSQLEAAQ